MWCQFWLFWTAARPTAKSNIQLFSLLGYRRGSLHLLVITACKWQEETTSKELLQTYNQFEKCQAEGCWECKCSFLMFLTVQNIFSIMLVSTSKVSSKDTLCQNQHYYNHMPQFLKVFKSHFLVYLKDVNYFKGNTLIYF